MRHQIFLVSRWYVNKTRIRFRSSMTFYCDSSQDAVLGTSNWMILHDSGTIVDYKLVHCHAPVGCCCSWSSKLHGSRGTCHPGVVLVTASCDVMLSPSARCRSGTLDCHRSVSAANVNIRKILYDGLDTDPGTYNYQHASSALIRRQIS